MELINKVSDVLHRMRVKLYPSCLPKIEGAYLAKTDSEATLSIEQVCATLKSRGGYTGRVDDAIDAVKEYLNEAMYQLCNGFSVSMGYFTIVPCITGAFNSPDEINDHVKHPVEFRFYSRAPLRRLAAGITVDVTGIVENVAYIDHFVDVASGSVNEIITPGEPFIIHGHKIKIVGDDAGIGIYLESEEDNTLRIKVEKTLTENTAVKIIGVVPQLPSPGRYRLVIITQFGGSSTRFLKEPRVITGKFGLEII